MKLDPRKQTLTTLLSASVLALALGTPALAGGDDECPTTKKSGATCQGETECPIEKAALVSLEKLDRAELTRLFKAAMVERPAAKSGEGTCCDAGECEDACKESWQAAQVLRKVLAKSEKGWTEFKPVLASALACDQTCNTVKAKMIDLVAMEPTPCAAAACAELQEEFPAAFTLEHKLSFAGIGCPVFGKQVAKLAKSEECCDPRPTLFLAMNGKEFDAARLEKLFEGHGGRTGEVAMKFLAAKALKKAGKPQYWNEVVQRTREYALAKLDAGELEAARGVALEAEFARKRLAKGLGGCLAYLPQQVKWHCSERQKEVAEADQVFAAVEAIGG